MSGPTEPFWLVWREGNQSPKFKHPTEESARTEAERLATLHPGEVFHVLTSVATCRPAGIAWVEHGWTITPLTAQGPSEETKAFIETAHRQASGG